MIKKITNYLKETRAEVYKVAWPGRKYVTSATVVIIIVSLVIGMFVMLMDLAFARIMMTLTQVF